MGEETDESWEPPDEFLSNTTVMNYGDDCVSDADYEPGKAEIYPDKCRQKEYPSLQATVLNANAVAVTTNRDAASLNHAEQTISSGGTKRKLQGLHGKQATPSRKPSALIPPIIFKFLICRMQKRHETPKLKNGVPGMGGRCLTMHRVEWHKLMTEDSCCRPSH